MIWNRILLLSTQMAIFSSSIWGSEVWNKLALRTKCKNRQMQTSVSSFPIFLWEANCSLFRLVVLAVQPIAPALAGLLEVNPQSKSKRCSWSNAEVKCLILAYKEHHDLLKTTRSAHGKKGVWESMCREAGIKTAKTLAQINVLHVYFHLG